MLRTDRTRDVRVFPAAALAPEQRRLADVLARDAVAAASTPKKLQARHIVPLKSEVMERQLKELTHALGGLDDIDESLCFNRCGSDPGAFTSEPAFKINGSGGPCTTHRDFDPKLFHPSSRCITFLMLCRNVGPHDGATYVYPGSRNLEKRVRVKPAESVDKHRGRPPKIKKRCNKQPGLNPRVLDQDLTNLCGDPISLAGKRLSIFRSESAEWHGAYRNTSDAARCVLIWSYASRELVGKIGVES